LINVRIRVVIEKSEESIESDIHTRGLDHIEIEGV